MRSPVDCTRKHRMNLQRKHPHTKPCLSVQRLRQTKAASTVRMYAMVQRKGLHLGRKSARCGDGWTWDGKRCRKRVASRKRSTFVSALIAIRCRSTKHLTRECMLVVLDVLTQCNWCGNRPVNPDAFDTDGHYPAFVGSGKRGMFVRLCSR